MDPFVYGVSPTYVLMTEGPLAAARATLFAADGALLIPLTGRIFWTITSALFFVGVFMLWREGGSRRAYALAFVTIVLYMIGLCFSNGAGINGRYRYPINPILYIPALYAALALLRWSVGVWRKRI